MSTLPRGGLSAYPVGSIYISINSINPSELFGGTWEQINNCFLLAQGDRFSAGSTGGEERHTLTIPELPSHDHPGYYSYAGVQQSIPRHVFNSGFSASSIYSGMPNFSQTVGGSQSHNNMPPYLTVYMWKRVA